MFTETSSKSSIEPRTDYLSWPRAALLAAGVIYGPELLMCLYTLGFVSCSHCKLAVWQIAPGAPGVFIYVWGHSIFGLPRFSNGVDLAFIGVYSLLVFCGLAAWLRCAGRWRIGVLSAATLGSAFIAVALLGGIRM